MEDRTLDPIIRPGSFVQSDSPQRTIPPVNWHDDFDRPIFFFELRDRYVCSWCELYGSHLILVPTAHSHGHARRTHYPGDVTIVGRVTGAAMSIAEVRESPTKASPLSETPERRRLVHCVGWAEVLNHARLCRLTRQHM